MSASATLRAQMSDPSGLVVAEETADRVVLEHRGPAPYEPLRLPIVAILALLLVPHACGLPGMIASRDVEAIVLTLVMCGFVLGIATLIAWPARYVRRLTADRGGITVDRDALLPWLRRTDLLARSAIKAMSCIALGVEGRPLVPTLRLRERDRDRVHAFPLAVAGVDRHGEVLDLATRIARVVGFDGHRVVRNEPRAIEIEFGRHDVLSERMPELAPEPGYASDRSAPVVASAALARFDPASVRHRGKAVIADWRPGVLVRSVSAAIGPLGLVGLSVGTALLLGVGVTALALFLGRPDPVWAFAVAALIGLLLPSYSLLTGQSLARREVVFDWRSRTVEARRGRKRAERRMADAREVLVHGRKEPISESSSVYYRCEVEVTFAEGAVLALRTERAKDQPDRPYRAATTFAAEIAQALGVPWRWNEYAVVGYREQVRGDRRWLP